ncbi:MAG: hypothetical protein B9S33_08850 [Pedosphaera sp. Tous-C6FEB]|nr:MAG: hypothetical protein B9S33_08850 [Pedosphaera sp. Tous-C6FEB]
MSDSMFHTEPLEERLACAVSATFVLVAAADRKVDKRELATLEKLCLNPSRFQSALFRSVIATIARDPGTYFNDLPAGTFQLMDTLGGAIRSLEQERPDEAQAFKVSLMEWGRAIAESRSRFAGLRGKMGKAEATALATIADLLELREPEAARAARVDDRLALAPLLVFKLVAAADGQIDRKERDQLAQLCENADEFPSPLFRDAVRTLMQDYDRLFAEVQDGYLDPVEALKAAGAELDTSHPEESDEFKQCLIRWGRAIARASGGVLGVGKKVGRQETQVLALIAAALGSVDER